MCVVTTGDGGHQYEEEHTLGKVASWRTSAASSRFELVIDPLGLLKLTRVSVMS